MTRKMLIRGSVLGALALALGGCVYGPMPPNYRSDGYYGYPAGYEGYYAWPTVSFGVRGGGGWHGSHGYGGGWHSPHWR